MNRCFNPNVLIVIADDHRADAIGALGHPVVRTPALDRLIRDGTTFLRAGIMGSLMPAVCAPSRACLFTGRDMFRADTAPGMVGGPDYEVRLPADAITLPECFGAAGYEPFFTGKWHNDLPALLRSFGAGKSIFHGGMCDHTQVPVRDRDEIARGNPVRIAAGFSTEIFCRAAERFIRERAGAGSAKKPFLACVSLTSPHDPRTPPREFRALYDPAMIPLPENFLPAHPFDNGELNVRDERLATRPLTPSDLREHLADYYGMISHHDAWIGRLLAALRETGQEARTIVVYLSDHGLAIGSHGLLGKQNLYEHSLRVPLVMSGPGIPRAERREALAYSLDLFATLGELAGVAVPAGLESRSLVPVLDRRDARGRTELCAAYRDCQRSVTEERWKLIVYRVGAVERVQLFDLASDPAECRDLSADPAHAATVTRLAARLAAWQERVGDRWMSTPLAARAKVR